jgi:hypothetical protein
MDYTVIFPSEKRGGLKVGVQGASCASEAESIARARHPEHRDSPVLDISQWANNSSAPANSFTSRKELAE